MEYSKELELYCESIIKEITCVCCGDEFRTTETQDICDKCFEKIIESNRNK